MLFGVASRRPLGIRKQGAGITTQSRAQRQRDSPQTSPKTFVCVREGNRAVPTRYTCKRDVDV